MAVVHPEAVLTPSKLELVATWLPTQAWFAGTLDDLVLAARFRFVDPDGQVGIETLLIDSGGVTYQVPLTYRDAPLAEAGEALIGTMGHSLLGTRWVYDAPADPVYDAEVKRVIEAGDTEADLSAGQKTAYANGSGLPAGTNLSAIHVVRVLDGHHVPAEPAVGTLTARWTYGGADRSETVVTAY